MKSKAKRRNEPAIILTSVTLAKIRCKEPSNEGQPKLNLVVHITPIPCLSKL